MKKLKLYFGSLWFSFDRSELIGTSLVNSHFLNFSYPPNLGQRLYYSTRQKEPLNPWWVIVFLEGEGCFNLGIDEDPKYKTGCRILPCIRIGIHKQDISRLEKFKELVIVGKIYSQGLSAVQWQVKNKKEIEIFIKHLDKFPLITQKTYWFWTI